MGRGELGVWGRKIKGIGEGGWGVGTLVLGRPVSLGVSSGGSAHGWKLCGWCPPHLLIKMWTSIGDSEPR